MTLEASIEQSRRWEQLMAQAEALFPRQIQRVHSVSDCPCNCGKKVYESSIVLRRVS